MNVGDGRDDGYDANENDIDDDNHDDNDDADAAGNGGDHDGVTKRRRRRHRVSTVLTLAATSGLRMSDVMPKDVSESVANVPPCFVHAVLCIIAAVRLLP
jgi:hypothetical protein